MGVGLFGEEGMQAANSADFALYEFRQLAPLILVHGHWMHYRIGNLILYFFYKNFLPIVAHLVLSFFNHFSAVSWHDPL